MKLAHSENYKSLAYAIIELALMDLKNKSKHSYEYRTAYRFFFGDDKKIKEWRQLLCDLAGISAEDLIKKVHSLYQKKDAG